MSHLLQESDITILEEDVGTRDLVSTIISELSGTDDDAFYVADLGNLVSKHLCFLSALPRVKPLYAVSCNSSRGVVQILAELGTGFECWSKTEMELVLGLGVSADRIIYANPCKQISHIKYAARNGVRLMAFDSTEELDKVSISHPNARMVLRLATDDSASPYPTSKKFGVPLKDCRHLLITAMSLNVEVVGVCFHVGSGCTDPQAFTQSISDARLVFDMAEKLGHKMRILDIGGGFPGTENAKVQFEKFAHVISSALDKNFPEACGVEVIAEPGRYYGDSAFILVNSIIAKKNGFLEQSDFEDGNKSLMYYLSNGVFGSFNNALFETLHLKPVPQKVPLSNQPLHISSLWGPTCDCADKVLDGLQLPNMSVGDWLIFDNMGAYTFSISSLFNGFLPAPIHYFMTRQIWNVMQILRKGRQLREEQTESSDIIFKTFNINLM